MVPALSAAIFLWEKSGRTYTPLDIERRLYVAALVHANKFPGERLFQQPFVATDFGPCLPSLRARLGGSKVSIKFRFTRQPTPTSDVVATLETTYRLCEGLGGADLIHLTHDEAGPWARAYQPGIEIQIPDAALAYEAARWLQAGIFRARHAAA